MFGEDLVRRWGKGELVFLGEEGWRFYRDGGRKRKKIYACCAAIIWAWRRGIADSSNGMARVGERRELAIRRMVERSIFKEYVSTLGECSLFKGKYISCR